MSSPATTVAVAEPSTTTATASTETTQPDASTPDPTMPTTVPATTAPTDVSVAPESVPDSTVTPSSADCALHGSERVVTDRADYPPESTVHLTGWGFAASCVVRVEVTRPDGSVVKGDGSFTPGVDEVVTTDTGTFAHQRPHRRATRNDNSDSDQSDSDHD
jgi:hypothetical protein